jgi:3-hydroxyisobutyrate dehydrogenase
MARIGFIGLGNMGKPMARCLLRAGHELVVFDTSPESVVSLVMDGAQAAATPSEAVVGVEAVVSMLPAGPQVVSAYMTDGGVLNAADPGTLLIDCSTIDVVTARRLGGAAMANGMEMVDAPVSGGVGAAEAGTLTFMVGGGKAAFDRAKPILEGMGKTIVHAGPSGNGQAAKICNNMILGVSMIAVCEAFALAEQLGLEAQTLFDISSKSSGQCWSLTSYCPVPGPVPHSPANRGYAAGFSAAMMLKDLRLAEGAALSAGAATPMGSMAANLYDVFCANGAAHRDFSAIVTMLQRKG